MHSSSVISRSLFRLSLAAVCVALTGCSILQEDKVDYRTAAKGNSLEVPPDLTQVARDNRFAVPGGVVTASDFQTPAAATQQTGVAATSVGDIRVERAGNQRWLVVGRSPEQLWDPIRGFWQENGFALTQDQQNIGIMETDWAENRAKLPQDFIRNTLGKVLNSLYDTGERDKFRTRLERTATGTEVFISHRGMVEKLVGGNAANATGTVWEPRAPSPELEAEFLRRLMVRLGQTEEQAKTQVTAATPKSTSRVASVGGAPVVQIDEGFERAWRRVGLALDRTGFTVEDRDRAQGMYFVRYVDPATDSKEPGFFGKLLGGAAPTKEPLKYRIAVKSQGEATTVSVLKSDGQPETSANAQRIVQVIADDLK